METALTTRPDPTPAPLAPGEVAKWTTPGETSALADSEYSSLAWSAAHAAKSFTLARATELCRRHDDGLTPANHGKLAARLRVLWESTTPTSNITAKAWLHETGRLLADLPIDIAYAAIDRALLASDKGFTPSPGAIRSQAEPLIAERRRHAARLRAVRDALDPSAAPAKPAADKPVEHDARTTAQILAEVWPTMGDHETGRREVTDGRNPDRPCRKPSREDYIRLFKIDPEAGGDADSAEAA